MKLLKRLFITLTLSLLFTATTAAQSGWNSGSFYAYQGQSITETAFQNEYSPFCNCYVTVRYCRQLNWYQEYHSGYIYLWNYNTGQWYTEWKEGYYWYCTWSRWYAC